MIVKKDKINLRDKSEEEKQENYTSLIDEFRRQKIIYNSKVFKADSINLVWRALEQTIAKTFRIKRELKQDIEFGIKVKGVLKKYLLILI